jgi:hypothetical protein
MAGDEFIHVVQAWLPDHSDSVLVVTQSQDLAWDLMSLVPPNAIDQRTSQIPDNQTSINIFKAWCQSVGRRA